MHPSRPPNRYKIDQKLNSRRRGILEVYAKEMDAKGMPTGIQNPSKRVSAVVPNGGLIMLKTFNMHPQRYQTYQYGAKRLPKRAKGSSKILAMEQD